MREWAESFLRVLFVLCVVVSVGFCGGFAYYATSKMKGATLPLQFSLKSGKIGRASCRERV